LKIGVLEGGGSVLAKFSRRRKRPPPIIFTRIDRPYNIVADGFTQRNFAADFLQAKCNIWWKMAILRFWASLFWGLGVTYDVHLRLIGKQRPCDCCVGQFWPNVNREMIILRTLLVYLQPLWH